MQSNTLMQKKAWKAAYKTLHMVAMVALIFNMSMVGVFFAPKTAQATSVTVCPAGDVKLEADAADYEYTDGSATITYHDGDEHNYVTWEAMPGYVVTSVCLKYGTQLDHPDATDGQAGPYSHDISHVVLTTTDEPITNPPLVESCGLDIGLVIDSSGSIDNSELPIMKNAFNGFVDAFLPGTPTQFSVVEFDNNVVGPTLPFTDDATPIKNRINAAVSGGWTNWEAALQEIHNQYDPTPKPDVIIFASDGNPNSTIAQPSGSASESEAVSAAISVANDIKADGIRIVALGIGENPDGSDPALDLDNLIAISGPNVAPPASIDTTADVILSDFDQLAQVLSDLADELCGGKILVQKQYDADGDGQVDYDDSVKDASLAGWEFTVNGTQKTTDTTGYLSFDVLNGTYSAVETNQKPNTHFVDASCEKEGQAIGTPTTNGVAGLTMDTDETIYCEFVNSANTGDITFEKVVVNGEAQPNEFTFHVNGNDYNNGDQDTFLVGQYQLTEDGPDGYSLVNAEGACELSQGDISPVKLTVTENGGTCTITNQADNGKIFGYKFNDKNENGTWDQPEEPALPGVTIDLSGEATDSQVTDANGYYEFTDLVPGNYTVSENIPDNYTNTTPASVDVTINPGDEKRVDFGNRLLECNLVITKTGTAEVDVNGEITYTVHYENLGDNVCTGGGVKITDKFPDNTTYVSESANPAATEVDSEKIMWNVGWIYPGEEGDLTFKVTADDPGDEICGDWEIDNQATYWAKNGTTGQVLTGESNIVTTTVYKECLGELTIIKHVEGGYDEASDFTMQVLGPSPLNFAGSETGVTNTVKAGSYVITESGSENYSLSFSGDCDELGNVTIEHGDSKTCTLTNTRDTSTIKVNKFVELPNDETLYNPEDWSWMWDNGTDNEADIAGGAMRTVYSGMQYSITEDMTHYPEDNYTTSWVCYEGDKLYSQGTGTSFDVTLEKDENLVCTFTNVRNTTEVTFDKVVVGGNHADTDWNFTIDGESGTFNEESDPVAVLTNASYNVTEDSEYNDLYTLTNASGICELVEGQIVMNTGEEGGVCVVENTRNTGDLKVVKYLDQDGTLDTDNDWTPAAGWTIEVWQDGALVDTQVTGEDGTYTWPNLPTGTYTAKEIYNADDYNALTEVEQTVEVVTNETTEVIFANDVIEKEPGLTLVKEITESNLVPGGSIAYQLTFGNSGNVDLTGVTITDDYPEQYVTVTNPGTGTDNGDTVVWNIGDLPVGATGTVTYTVSINQDTPANTDIINIAVITSDQTGPVQSSATTEIPAKPGEPKLTIVKSVDKEFVNPGDTATYTVTVANEGDDTAVNVELTDLLPTGFTFVDFGTGSHTWSLGDIEAGDEVTITYAVAIADTVTEGTYDNLAVASADNHGNVTDSVGLEVRLPTVLAEEADPILTIEKTADKEFINQGDTVTYTIKVTNNGDEDAEAVALNVNVQDVMPAGFTFEDGEVTKVWELGDIRPGETKEISYTGVSDKTVLPGDYENLAIAWAENHDKVSDSVSVEVRKVEVLGEELPTTGGSLLTILYFIAAGLIVLFSGVVLKLTISKDRS